MFQIKAFTFSPIQENTYLLYNESKECIIIDPGCYFDEENQELKSFIESLQLRPTLLLNTHCHLDHVFGNKFIADTYNLTLHIHAKEEPVLQFASAAGLMYQLPFDNYMGELIYLKEGDKIKLGEDELEILHAPGHSPGSICFYCPKQSFIISGDVLFYRSIGRTDLPLGDAEELQKSIREKLYTLPDNVTTYSGHGQTTTIGEEKAENPFVRP
jgi:hydroxyacylglutathione hydrolase